MLIENPDAFKCWLTSVLEPLCDADPEALAKYVFALVKKDKPLEELRQCMIEQLDVFLQSETKPFVELLFKTLEKQEYLNIPIIPNANPPNPNVHNASIIKREPGSPKSTSDTLVVKDMKPIIPVSTLPNLSESINGTVKSKPEEIIIVSSSTKRDHRKSDSEKDEPSRGRNARTRHRSSSRNRSRSRSWDRSVKRSRSRERSPRIERRDRSRPWRNKSPPRRYDRERRRSRSSSPIGGRMRSRSRSPRHSYRTSGRYRNRSPPRSISKSRSRSNERSNRIDKDKKDTKLDKDIKDDNSGGATPTQDSNHGDTDMRLTNTTQSIQSVVSALNPLGTTPNSTVEGFVPSTKRRCRDFDEKGYCMRGEMCPYDHGVDPVVLEDSALSRVLTFGPNGTPQVVSDGTTAPGTPGMIHPMGMIVAGVPGFHQRGTGVPPEYNPSAPGMHWHHRPGFRPRGPTGPSIRGAPIPQGVVGPFGPMPSIQRELINVPVTDNLQGSTTASGTGGYKRRADYNHHTTDIGQQPPIKKRQGGFDFNRLGPRTGPSGPIIKNPANCSLELKKVPRGLNNITHLNNHFSKFGKIVNIQVCFEGDPEGAIVTFSSHAEANAAYRSTEAVLNNRFIKVFWHSGGENIPPQLGTSQGNNNNNVQRNINVKERLGQPVNNSNNKVLNLVQPKATDLNNDENDTNTSNTDDDNNKTNKLSSTTATTNSSNVYVPSSVKKDTAALLQQKEDNKALANAAIAKNQEILAAKEQLKKKHEEKRKEALKITQDLRKRKQELLEKQLAQQKLLIEKLEKTNPSGQQRELLMSTIKTVQESIESIRKDMLSSTLTPITSAKVAIGVTPRKSKEEAQREVLDAELDLITRQQEGGDTSELQKRLLELRAQAYSLSRGGGGGGPRRGRGGGAALRARHQLHHHHHHHMHHHNITKNNMVLDNTKRLSASTIAVQNKKTHTVVDHRPTRLLVSGYEADESESVLAHFIQYGEIIEYVTDESTPSIILIYRTRKEAEIAVLKGKHFQDRTLSVTWCTDAQLNTIQRAANSRTVVLNTTSNISVNNDTSPTNNTKETLDSKTIDSTKLDENNDLDEQHEKINNEQVNIIQSESTEEIGLNNTEDQLLEGDDENISGEPLGAELSEEALLQDDEEDIDEDEDRSWRR